MGAVRRTEVGDRPEIETISRKEHESVDDETGVPRLDDDATNRLERAIFENAPINHAMAVSAGLSPPRQLRRRTSSSASDLGSGSISRRNFSAPRLGTAASTPLPPAQRAVAPPPASSSASTAPIAPITPTASAAPTSYIDERNWAPTGVSPARMAAERAAADALDDGDYEAAVSLLDQQSAAAAASSAAGAARGSGGALGSRAAPTPVAAERPRAAPTPLLVAAAASRLSTGGGSNAALGARATSFHRRAAAEREKARSVPAPAPAPLPAPVPAPRVGSAEEREADLAEWDRPMSKPKPLKRSNSAERDRLERSVSRNLARATSFHRKVAAQLSSGMPTMPARSPSENDMTQLVREEERAGAKGGSSQGGGGGSDGGGSSGLLDIGPTGSSGLLDIGPTGSVEAR